MSNASSGSRRGGGGGGLGLVIGAGVIAAVGAVDTLGHLSKSNLGPALLAGGLAGAFVGLAAQAVVRAIMAGNEEAARQRASAAAAEARQMSEFVGQLQAVSGQQPLISERAKAIAYRERDREVVRQAMREEISKGNWETATSYLTELEKTFNDKPGADQLRAEFSQLRNMAIRQEFERVREVVAKYQGIEDWVAALREATDFVSRYPEFDEARSLPKEVEARKMALRSHLMARWHEAVAAKDDENGIQILRKLDNYLTREEAAGMQEDARTLISERRIKLRDQFTNLVSQQKWSEAVRMGDQIQNEFPNSKLAQEIRASMDSLRERAAEDSGSPT